MSAPAAPRRRVLAQAAFETRMLLGNGEQLLVSVLLPAIALVGLALASVPDLGPGRRVDLATAGTLALAVLSTAFTGQAIATGFDRRAGVLRLLGTTPLGRDGLLAGKALAVLSVLGVQVLLLGGLGAVLGWRPAAAGLLPALVTLLLGTATLVALALLLAGTVRAEAVLAVANLVWVLLLGLGTLVPTDVLPAPLRGIAQALPGGALGDALRTSLVSGGWPWTQWAVLAAWGVVGGAAAARWFRWSG
ncbi:ABC transporter permease [Phycicoccus avicenniae]|uniref:ABC transporter permease n=1 Tax=Phycicoccus avicenniae TaxID=2828860 RepID=UPI003D2B3614